VSISPCGLFGLSRSASWFQYAEAVTRSERDRAREEAVYRAQDWTPVPAVEAMPDGQAEIFELAEPMYPPPLGAGDRVDFRTRAAREWNRNRLAVMRVWVDLVEAALVEIIISADGVHGDLFTVSEAGHRWLVEHDTLTGGEGLP
jgi:hypothetical protein